MYVLTADQIGSRRADDLVEPMLARLRTEFEGPILRDPERTVGDELQVITDDAATALDVVLLLTRARVWSIGLGIGPAETPLPRETRAARGAAFILAREAVETAKSRAARMSLLVAPPAAAVGTDIQPFLELLILLRDRRTDAGWALSDLLATGANQTEAAHKLGITVQAASQRARAAGLRTEASAIPALIRTLTAADVASGGAVSD